MSTDTNPHAQTNSTPADLRADLDALLARVRPATDEDREWAACRDTLLATTHTLSDVIEYAEAHPHSDSDAHRQACNFLHGLIGNLSKAHDDYRSWEPTTPGEKRPVGHDAGALVSACAFVARDLTVARHNLYATS